MKKIEVLVLLTTLLFASNSLAQAAEKPNLCLTLRGNGFKIPAHFGSVARIVESGGLPDVIVGSSSGSVTAFLVDSVALNPLLSKDPEAKKLEAALLIKSIPEFMVAFINQDEIKKVRAIARDPQKQAELKKLFNSFGDMDLLSKIAFIIKESLTNPTFRDLFQIQGSPYFKELINPEFLAYMSETSKIKAQAQSESDASKKQRLLDIVAYRQTQSASTLGSLAKFDVRTDTNLFFRSGIINYAGMVKVWDRMADFYAAYNWDKELLIKFPKWLKQCAPLSKGKTFSQLSQAAPQCSSDFQEMAAHYLNFFRRFDTDEYPNCTKRDHAPGCIHYRYQDALDKKIQSYVITSVFEGDSASNFKNLLDQFPQTTDSQFGARFKLKFADFKIGLYGPLEAARKAQAALDTQSILDSSQRSFDFSQDYKAQHQMILGNTTWLEALTRSTAEPGQSQPQIITNLEGKTLLSMGGWPDPNPVQWLKGLGCQESIAIVTTAKTGNYFGEQVMDKIFDDMTGLKDLDENKIANGSDDFTSDWGVWRNLKNPHSSNALAFQASEGIFCTQWDEYDPFGKAGYEANFRALSDAGYAGALFIPEDVAADQPIRKWEINKILRSDDVWDQKYQRNRYRGCIPVPRS